jgi:TrmH family RNA methyltransferase
LSEDYAGIRDFKNAVTFSGRLFAKLSSTQSPQGIIAVVEKKHYSIEETVKKSSLLIVLENIQDPGNLGTIIRSADAFGVSAIFVSKESADIHSDKAVRASMDSLFHLPVVDNVNVNKLTNS